MANRRKTICIEDVEKLAQIGATQHEMARFFKIDTNTMERRLQEKRYRDALNSGDSNLKISLRRKQVEMALKGDRCMLIWLGKQFLGQVDKQETTGTMEVSGQVDVRAAIMQVIMQLPEDSRAIIARGMIEIEKAG